MSLEDEVRLKMRIDELDLERELTARELNEMRMVRFGIRPNDMVKFKFGGRHCIGRVARVETTWSPEKPMLVVREILPGGELARHTTNAFNWEKVS